MSSADPAAAPASSSAASASPVSSPDAEAVDLTDPSWFESADDAMENRVPPRRLLRAEAILARRTSRLLLVIETLTDENNHQALLRTADSFGIQHVWVVRNAAAVAAAAASPHSPASYPAGPQLTAKVRHRPSARQAAMSQVLEDRQQVLDSTGAVSMGAGRWLTLRYFDSTTSCIQALREAKRSIWVTTLRPGARVLDRSFPASAVPASLALVVGREIDGVSPEMTSAADAAVFLPMQGFSESFNVSVAGALAIQRIMDLIPGSIGDLSSSEKDNLRKLWYSHLASVTPPAVDDYTQYWLPRAAEVAEQMRQMEAQEAAAQAQDGAAPAAGPLSVSALLRPLEELRVPKIQRRLRKRMEAQGHRAVILPNAAPAAEKPASGSVVQTPPADSASSSAAGAPASAGHGQQ